MQKNVSLHHYQPEIDFLENKQRIGARICTDACCIVDTRDNLKILAARGLASNIPLDFPTATCMTEIEREIFVSALERRHRFYFCIGKKPWLIFTDWLKSTGLVLILSPKGEPFAIKDALSHFIRQHFVFPQSFREDTPSSVAAWQDAFDILSDIFALIDTLSDNTPTDGKTRLSSIASLVGCRLDFSDHNILPFLNALQLQSPRSLAFLFCSFLFLHRQYKEISVQDDSDSSLLCRLSLQYPTEQEKTASVPAFVLHPCFESCNLQYGTGVATVLLSEQADATALGASNPTPVMRSEFFIFLLPKGPL